MSELMPTTQKPGDPCNICADGVTYESGSAKRCMRCLGKGIVVTGDERDKFLQAELAKAIKTYQEACGAEVQSPRPSAEEIGAQYLADKGIKASPRLPTERPKSALHKETDRLIALAEERREKFGDEYALRARLDFWEDVEAPTLD